MIFIDFMLRKLAALFPGTTLKPIEIITTRSGPAAP